MLLRESADRTGHQCNGKCYERSLDTEVKSCGYHQEYIAPAHCFFVRQESDDRKRYADYECTDDVRADRSAVVISAKYYLCDCKHSDKDNYPCVYQLCVPVHKENYDQSGEHQTGQDYVHRKCYNVKVKSSHEPDSSVEKFYYRVPRRYLRPAVPALSTENAPADYRYQVVAFDLLTAGHTVRVLLRKALTQRQSVNADVEEASHAYAEDEHKCVDNDIVYV